MSKSIPESRAVRQYHAGITGTVFRVLFWLHQILIMIGSLTLFAGLQDERNGVFIISAEIGIFLLWIGGMLLWGFAALLHQNTVYELPPPLASIESLECKKDDDSKPQPSSE